MVPCLRQPLQVQAELLRMDTSRIHPGLVGPQVSETIRGVTNRVMNSWLQIYDLQTLS